MSKLIWYAEKNGSSVVCVVARKSGVLKIQTDSSENPRYTYIPQFRLEWGYYSLEYNRARDIILAQIGMVETCRHRLEAMN